MHDDAMDACSLPQSLFKEEHPYPKPKVTGGKYIICPHYDWKNFGSSEHCTKCGTMTKEFKSCPMCNYKEDKEAIICHSCTYRFPPL